MPIPDREDIHIISRHSNLSASGIRSALDEFVYSSKSGWQQFLRIMFLSLGAGFLLAGIIFFFAYNWDQLNKFVKLGIMEGLIILLTLTALLMRKNILLRKFLLTGASILVGVLFAIFGQVYQTGADAYDLFLNWTLCIFLWVLVADFAPLWLVWLILLNLTAQLYVQQIRTYWPTMSLPIFIYSINVLSIVIALLLKHVRKAEIPSWFVIVLALGAVTISTISVSIGIFERNEPLFGVLMILVIVSYAAAIWYGYNYKSLFYLALTGCSVIIIICAAILNATVEAGGILFVCLFIAGAITGLIKGLLTLQKNWNLEKAD